MPSQSKVPSSESRGQARTSAVKGAIVIGSSDGIGFATAEALLAEGWEVVGVSRAASMRSHTHYTHFICDLTSDDYRRPFREQSAQPFQAVIYSVGIGEPVTLGDELRGTKIEIGLGPRNESRVRLRMHKGGRSPTVAADSFHTLLGGSS